MPVKKIFIISDSKVFPTESIGLINEFEKNHIKCESLSMEINEKKKNLESCNSVYEWLLERGAERNSFILSVGGGVTTDMVGYISSTWLRGLNVIHYPTSLAAMVDASIGGKTGVNFKHGKNLIGAFKQPKLIVMDTQSLESLKDRELNSGWAEAIKHSFLFDKDLLLKFNSHNENITRKEDPIFTEIINFCTQHEFIYSHSWTLGDVLIWDERSILHRGRPWPYEEPRTMASICVSVGKNDGFNI